MPKGNFDEKLKITSTFLHLGIQIWIDNSTIWNTNNNICLSTMASTSGKTIYHLNRRFTKQLSSFISMLLPLTTHKHETLLTPTVWLWCNFPHSFIIWILYCCCGIFRWKKFRFESETMRWKHRRNISTGVNIWWIFCEFLANPRWIWWFYIGELTFHPENMILGGGSNSNNQS